MGSCARLKRAPSAPNSRCRASSCSACVVSRFQPRSWKSPPKPSHVCWGWLSSTVTSAVAFVVSVHMPVVLVPLVEVARLLAGTVDPPLPAAMPPAPGAPPVGPPPWDAGIPPVPELPPAPAPPVLAPPVAAPPIPVLAPAPPLPATRPALPHPSAAISAATRPHRLMVTIGSHIPLAYTFCATTSHQQAPRHMLLPGRATGPVHPASLNDRDRRSARRPRPPAAAPPPARRRRHGWTCRLRAARGARPSASGSAGRSWAAGRRCIGRSR